MHSGIINSTVLLAPIAGENPAGIDIRQDASSQSLYRQIKQIRTNARTVERQQLQGNNQTAQADWKKVYQLAINILTSHSKDIEITVWLIEALLRLDGFSGLNSGFKLTSEMVTQYWDLLYPLPDEEGINTRLAPIAGLNGEDIEGSLIVPIALTPLISKDLTIPITLWHYQQALEIDKIPNKQKPSDSVTLNNIEQALKEVSVDLIQSEVNTLKNCIENYQQLVSILGQKCNSEPLPSSRITTQLNSCLECLMTLGQVPLPTSSSTIETTALVQPDSSKPDNLNVTKAQLTREQMLLNLLEAAQFFRSTEPHSPLPYILERAVRWAKMPLPDLLKELLQDEQSKKQLSNLTGIEFK